MRHFKPALLAALASTIAAPALAATAVGVSGDADLHWIDTETWQRTGGATVTGVEGRLLGIDVRPADGRLYGLFEDGTLAVIDPMTGAAESVSTLATMLPADATATVDFNPVADKLRVMGSDGTSLRVTVETGEVVTQLTPEQVRDLTALLGAERHLTFEDRDPADIAALLAERVSDQVQARIAQLRAQSAAWLDAALAGRA